MPADSSAARRARGEIETLPSGSLRVRVYAGVDPVTRKRRYLTATVPAGPRAAEEAERVRARLLREARERPSVRDTAGTDPTPLPTVGDRTVRRRRGELTVAAIAQLAGVSAPTVSKVLNGRAGVAPQTRRRVEELLRHQGYRRPERVTRGPFIEVVCYGMLSHLAVELMRGVKRVAVERDLTVGFTDVLSEASTGRNWAHDLLARRPTGVIAVHLGATAEQHGVLTAGAIPLIAVDPIGEPLQPVPTVRAANRSGGIAAAQHLLNLGHRRIAVISGPPDRLAARARVEGVRAALAAAGVPVDEGLIRAGMWFSFEDGFSHGRELLRLSTPPTAVLCGNDLQAFGVYEAVRQAGLRLPGDLSVVGFDDISYARWCGPPLTTVHQPFAEMGATAARMLLAVAAGESISQTTVELAATLVVRDSTAPPPELTPAPA